MAAFMQIDERRVAGVTILKLSGRLELDDGAEALRDHINQLVDRGRVHVVLDMKNVTRLDSAGIGVLVGKYLTVKKRGGSIKLLNLTERSSRLLQITKLESVFEIFSDENAAVLSFSVTA